MEFNMQTFSSKGKTLSKKHYYKGLLKKKNFTNKEGKEYENNEWKLYYVELIGQNMVFYKPTVNEENNEEENLQDFKLLEEKEVQNIKHNNIEKKTIKITNASIRKDVKLYENCFILNTEGQNIYYFKSGNAKELREWILSIRFCVYENILLQTMFTKTIQRTTKITTANSQFSGYVDLNLNGNTANTKCYLETKKNFKEANAFSYKNSKKTLLTITNIKQSFLVYPEKPELVNECSNVKILCKPIPHPEDQNKNKMEQYFVFVECEDQSEALKLCLCLNKINNLTLECDKNKLDSDKFTLKKIETYLKVEMSMLDSFTKISDCYCNSNETSKPLFLYNNKNTSNSSASSSTSGSVELTREINRKLKSTRISRKSSTSSTGDRNKKTFKNKSVLPESSSDSSEDDNLRNKGNLPEKRTSISSGSSAGYKPPSGGNYNQVASSLNYPNGSSNIEPQHQMFSSVMSHQPAMNTFPNTQPPMAGMANNSSLIYQRPMMNPNRPSYLQRPVHQFNNYNPRGPLVDLPQKKSEPTGGLVGAISAIQQQRLLNKKNNINYQQSYNDNQQILMLNNNPRMNSASGMTYYPQTNNMPVENNYIQHYPYMDDQQLAYENAYQQRMMGGYQQASILANRPAEEIKPTRVNRSRQVKNPNLDEVDYAGKDITDDEEEGDSDADVVEEVAQAFDKFADKVIEMKPYAYIPTKKLYTTFKRYCEQQEIENEDIPNIQIFEKIMFENGYVKKHINNTDCWYNIAVILS